MEREREREKTHKTLNVPTKAIGWHKAERIMTFLPFIHFFLSSSIRSFKLKDLNKRRKEMNTMRHIFKKWSKREREEEIIQSFHAYMPHQHVMYMSPQTTTRRSRLI